MNATPKTFQAIKTAKTVRKSIAALRSVLEENHLADAIRDNLSPEAVAVIASGIQLPDADDDGVGNEIQWFRDLLLEIVGGYQRANAMAAQLGKCNYLEPK